MESSSSFADRLAALEARVDELEAAGESAPEAAVPAETQVEPGRTESAPTEAAPAQVPVGSAADALPDDADTFWALHGLVDCFGAGRGLGGRCGGGGGVTYTGYTTRPGAEGRVAWQMGLTSEGLNEIDFAEAAGCLAALGHPVRLQLLQAIYEGTTTVAELSKDE